MAKRKLESPTVIRLDTTGNGHTIKPGSFWLMNRRETGWSSFGYNYATLGALLDEWDLELGEHGQDKASTFIHALPKKGEGR